MAYTCNACGRWVTTTGCDCYRQTPISDPTDTLRELLHEVEWVEGYDSQDFHVMQCPICHADKHDGHLPDCRLAEALR